MGKSYIKLALGLFKFIQWLLDKGAESCVKQVGESNNAIYDAERIIIDAKAKIAEDRATIDQAYRIKTKISEFIA